MLKEWSTHTMYEYLYMRKGNFESTSSAAKINRKGWDAKPIKFTMKMKCTEKQKKDNARREVKTKHQWK